MNANFTSPSQASEQDIQHIAAAMHDYAANQAPKAILALLTALESDNVFPVNRLQHSLQSATLAYQDNADEEMIVVALLHDIGESLSPFSHAEVAASILKPFLSEKRYWLLKHHDIFQGYYFWDKMGGDKNARNQFLGHPCFEETALFCERYDNPAFDPNFEAMPLSAFEPMVYRLFAKPLKS